MNKAALFACVVGTATAAFGQAFVEQPPPCYKARIADSLQAIGMRTYPALSAASNRANGFTAGLVFDHHCKLIKSATGTRGVDKEGVSKTLATLFPAARLDSWYVNGVSIATADTGLMGPRIVFVVLRDPYVQYRAEGVSYLAQLDTGPVARAERAFMSDPRNIDKIIALGVAQSGIRQFRDAIATFSYGLSIEPDNALLLRWRGHRYLSTRQFDRALADFTRGSQLDSTIYGIWYHLGIVRYANGDFAGAADAFKRGQPRAPNADELAGSTDWLWMSLARAGRRAEADAMLARKPDSLPSTAAYVQRLKLYRGHVKPDSVFTPADTADVQVATLAYGIGNWYLVNGDTTRARAWFERSVASGAWPGFGFIISEIELRRLSGRR